MWLYGFKKTIFKTVSSRTMGWTSNFEPGEPQIKNQIQSFRIKNLSNIAKVRPNIWLNPCQNPTSNLLWTMNIEFSSSKTELQTSNKKPNSNMFRFGPSLKPHMQSSNNQKTTSEQSTDQFIKNIHIYFYIIPPAQVYIKSIMENEKIMFSDFFGMAHQ